MLKSLNIRHYKLIEEALFEPGQGFTVLTGETGAGKSTLMGAFGLLLGDRAEASIWKENEDKCVVEGLFLLKDHQLRALFEQEELDYHPECLIRREVSPSGKSRVFVNDTPTTLEVIKAIAQQLVDIHSQHENLSIGEEDQQLETLDVFADLLADKHKLAQGYRVFQDRQRSLKKLQANLAKQQEDLDYNTFLFSELQALPLDELNQEELEAELDMLENAEGILAQIAETKARLEDEQLGALEQLAQTEKTLGGLADFGKEFQALSQQFSSALRELEDALEQLHQRAEAMQLDPDRLQLLSETSDKLNALYRKHKTNQLEDLRTLRDELREKIRQAEFADQDLAQLEKEVRELEANLLLQAKAMSKKRKNKAPELAKTLQALLQKLGMPKAQVEVQLTDKPLHAAGTDQVNLLFSANSGVAPAPIAKAASGGEYSRIMLAVKSILAGKVQLPTLFFDEIDAGVSGQVAIQVADVLKKLAENHQVISITHMPQVAAKGQTHYQIYKDHSADKSVTKLKALDKTAKIEEIAGMIGGDKKSKAALQSAKELIEG